MFENMKLKKGNSHDKVDRKKGICYDKSYE